MAKPLVEYAIVAGVKVSIVRTGSGVLEMHGCSCCFDKDCLRSEMHEVLYATDKQT